MRQLGFMEQVREVLTGKTVYLTDFNAPYKDLIRYFNVVDRDIQTISSDITCFPYSTLRVKWNTLLQFLFSKDIRGKKKSTGQAIYELIGWSCLMRTKLLKRPVSARLISANCLKTYGRNPHEYYINYKISKLKEKLLDTNLSISRLLPPAI